MTFLTPFRTQLLGIIRVKRNRAAMEMFVVNSRGLMPMETDKLLTIERMTEMDLTPNIDVNQQPGPD